MSNWKNLSLLRKFIQLLAFIFLVYGSSIIGFYAADKISGTLPALSCAYDTKTADYCVLIPFQHIIDHRIGAAIVSGADIIKSLIPLFTTLLSFLVMFVFLNKAFCGWICPLGFFQELVHIIGQKLGLQRDESLSKSTVNKLRPIKWAILGLLVFGFPFLSGIGLVGHELGSPFCSICPSRLLTSLASGDSSQFVVDTSSTGYFVLSLLATFGFGLMIALALTLRQPFCRVCPMLALHAVFRKLGFVRLIKDAKPRCEKCGICAKACPMDIREIHTDMDNRDVTYPDCTLCGRCVEFCPDQNVLRIQYIAQPIFSAAPQYFKQRKKQQKQWEQNNLLQWFRKRKNIDDNEKL